MTTAASPRRRGFTFLLPADWVAVPLRDVAQRRRAIADFVASQAGRSDALTSLRADLRRHLNAAADQAAAIGGTHLAFSLMRWRDLPLAATLTTYHTGVPVELTDPARLAAALGAADAGVFRGEDRTVLRRIRTGQAPAQVDEAGLPQLLVDYWIAIEGADDVIALCFSTPILAARDGFLALFDALADSVALDDLDDGTGNDEATE